MIKIGNSDIYIEINSDTYSGNMANLILVVDGVKLGTFSSPTYIPSFIHSLDSLLSEEIYFCEYVNDSLFKKIVEMGKLENKNIFTLEETFDDFMKRCIRGNDALYFYFRLYKDHFFDYVGIVENTPIIRKISINSFSSFLNDVKHYFY